MLTQEELKKFLHYEPETGMFIWLVDRGGGTKIGNIAGFIRKDGYRHIKIFSKHYLSGRLAFFYMTGKWPEHEIDHINRIRDDDRWCNLRVVTRQQNNRNQNIQKNNTSGIKGVHWIQRLNKWQARIWINKKTVSLGCFNNIEEAAKARKEAEIEYFGEYI